MAPLDPKIARFGKALLWISILWASAVLIGYGAALRSRASQGFKFVHINNVGPTDGKVEWVRKFGERYFGFYFRIEGHPETFYVPAEYVRDDGAWELIDQGVAPGKLIWVKASPEDHVAIQLRVGFRSQEEKEPVQFETVTEVLPKMPGLISQKGTVLIVAGILLFAISTGTRLWQKRRKTA